MTDEVKDLFVEKIIKNKIKPPTRHDFNLDKWLSEWEKIKDNASKRDARVFVGGSIVDSLGWFHIPMRIIVCICQYWRGQRFVTKLHKYSSKSLYRMKK